MSDRAILFCNNCDEPLRREADGQLGCACYAFPQRHAAPAESWGLLELDGTFTPLSVDTDFLLTALALMESP